MTTVGSNSLQIPVGDVGGMILRVSSGKLLSFLMAGSWLC